MCTTWLKKGSALLLGNRLRASVGPDGPNDPTDDGTCPDPTDDDQTSKDVTVSEETIVPVIAVLRELVPYLTAAECASPTWTEVPSSPSFLTLQRLRC